MKYLLLIVTLSATFNAQTQHFGQGPTCGFKPKMGEEERQQLASRFASWRQNNGRRLEETSYTIPTVVHLIESNAVISDQAVIDAISSLNDAFAWRGEFQNPTGVPTGIQFCLAETAPDGGATTGITRISSDYARFDMDMEVPDIMQLAHWDPSRYLNIWVVDQIDAESAVTYSGRSWWERFGVAAFASDIGVFTSTISPSVLAHECGHYLSLLHTFDGLPCRNFDCLVDGDMVCDTPPDSSVEGPCPQNSCNTDTLSNFSNGFFLRDTYDANNFMDYTSCPEAFTLGQAARMHFDLETNKASLYVESGNITACSAPCSEETWTRFTIDNIHPVAGESVLLMSESSGNVSRLEWFITPLTGPWTEASAAISVGTDDTLTYVFPEEGWYQLLLRARQEGANCFASYARNIRVTCGIDARFFPDKRLIASKQPHALFTDSVLFTNRSVGGTQYQWTVQHVPMPPESERLPDFESSDQHLEHYFREPGFYYISLRVSDETGCQDNTPIFELPVLDPTIDGLPSITNLFCYNQEQVLLTLNVYNNGYDTIPAGSPVSFYDADPRLTSPTPNLLKTVELSDIVYGFDQLEMILVLDREITSLDKLYVVFNDPGQTDFPIQFPPADLNRLSKHTVFPPTGHAETNYENNVFVYDFEEQGIRLPDLLACPGDTVQLSIADTTLTEVAWYSLGSGLLGTTNPFGYEANQTDTILARWSTTLACSLSDTFLIQVVEPAAFVPEDEFRILLGEHVEISAEGGGLYRWSPVEGLSDPQSASPLASPAETTLYTVEVTDEFGCISTASVSVYVETPGFIPNLFTPNGDGSNDYLQVYGLSEVSEVLLRIFNRTGRVVYESASLQEITSSGWDGSSAGNKQPTGVYFWEISGRYASGYPLTLNGQKTGTVHLIR